MSNKFFEIDWARGGFGLAIFVEKLDTKQWDVMLLVGPVVMQLRPGSGWGRK